MFFIPSKNIKKTFKNDKAYNRWKNNFLEKNENIISNHAKENNVFFNKLFSKKRNDLFYEKAVRELMYEKIVRNRSKKILER